MTISREHAISNALNSIKLGGPADLLGEIWFQQRLGGGMTASEREAVFRLLLDDSGGNPLHIRFRYLIFDLDNAKSGTKTKWVKKTLPNTRERRKLTASLLCLTEKEAELLTATLPFTECGSPLVIAEEHQDWLHESQERERTEFFFDKYLELLKKRGWNNYSCDSLRRSTEAILESLSAPVRPKAYQSRGLVMGYVQSGKTANFAGLVARSADHGYRLFIILAGTMNILRNQTQRRLDKDLIGRELLTEEECYRSLGDKDWEEFVSYGNRPSAIGGHDWVRLTSLGNDYQQLKAGSFEILRPEKEIKSKPLNDPGNLFSPRIGCRILVVKKHQDVLAKMLVDFTKIKNTQPGLLDELPTLIIDDESDQASLDTRRPDPKETKRRRAVNEKVTSLVNFFKRGQYVGYTATPYAHVLTNREDKEDLFPRDFIISLPKPPGDYMGVYDFFESDSSKGGKGFHNKEDAFIRAVSGDNTSQGNLPMALGSFVLSGAIKLFRMKTSPAKFHFHHHTMLIHTSVQRSEHERIAVEVWKEYDKCGFNTINGIKTLEKLWKTDYEPVSKAQGQGLPNPQSFSELKPFISECLRRIESNPVEITLGGQLVRVPIYVVNSDTDLAPNFDEGKPVWKIIVGGSKLSRGYTIEALTISYYRRTAKPGDTLMQMGRWFGYRRGYRDLVRLYIGTQESRGKNSAKTMNLVERFRDLSRTEEALRIGLEQYIRRADGGRLKPGDVPPLIRLYDKGDPITAANKRLYAQFLNKNYGGLTKETTQAPDPTSKSVKSRGKSTENIKIASNLLAGASIKNMNLGGLLEGGKKVDVPVLSATIPHAKLLEFLKEYRWNDGQPADIAYQIDFLERDAHGIHEWQLIAPQKQDSFGSPFIAGGKSFKVKQRTWLGTRFGVYSESGHVAVAKYIAGIKDDDTISLAKGNPDTDKLVKKGRGCLVFYPVRNDKTEAISMGFVLAYPENTLGFLSTMSAK